ncbi:hypothetical protein PR048_029498 [Dryococelus australis]|uniref:Uncharacterized protein n=1 Tax=Dryococelus australis TaxID=614101 RepID=A0ABQ9GFS9_9NEOP|nr:hypothetical protein PR048_029498 [Dryococelus australis]
MMGCWKREIPEKTRRPPASYGTILYLLNLHNCTFTLHLSLDHTLFDKPDFLLASSYLLRTARLRARVTQVTGERAASPYVSNDRPLTYLSSKAARGRGAIAPGFLHVGIVPHNAAGWRIFSGISPPPPPSLVFKRFSIFTSLHFTSPSSALKTSMLRAAQFSHLPCGNFHLLTVFEDLLFTLSLRTNVLVLQYKSLETDVTVDSAIECSPMFEMLDDMRETFSSDESLRQCPSTGSQQMMSSMHPAASMVTVSADDYGKTVNAKDGMIESVYTDEHTTPATKKCKLGIYDETGSEDDHEDSIDEDNADSDSVEDDDDSLGDPTYFSNDPSTRDAKKAEDRGTLLIIIVIKSLSWRYNNAVTTQAFRPLLRANTGPHRSTTTPHPKLHDPDKKGVCVERHAFRATGRNTCGLYTFMAVGKLPVATGTKEEKKRRLFEVAYFIYSIVALLRSHLWDPKVRYTLQPYAYKNPLCMKFKVPCNHKNITFKCAAIQIEEFKCAAIQIKDVIENRKLMYITTDKIQQDIIYLARLLGPTEPPRRGRFNPRPTTRNSKVSVTYILVSMKTNLLVRVYKEYFMNTFSISRKRLENLNKVLVKGGTPNEKKEMEIESLLNSEPKKDSLRKFLNGLPASESHYNRKNSHLKDNAVYELASKDDVNTMSFCFDMQKVQPLPKTPIQDAYYARQISLYNLCIVLMNAREPSFFTWSKTQSERGALEVGSALFEYLTKLTIPLNIHTPMLFCDDTRKHNIFTTKEQYYDIFKKHGALKILGAYWVLYDVKSLEESHKNLQGIQSLKRIIIKRVQKSECKIITHEYYSIETGQEKHIVVRKRGKELPPDKDTWPTTKGKVHDCHRTLKSKLSRESFREKKKARWCCGQRIRLPPRRTGFDSRRGRSRIFARGNRARMMPLVGGVFSGNFRFHGPFHSGAAPYSARFTFIGSQDLAVTRRPKFFTFPAILATCVDPLVVTSLAWLDNAVRPWHLDGRNTACVADLRTRFKNAMFGHFHVAKIGDMLQMRGVYGLNCIQQRISGRCFVRLPFVNDDVSEHAVPCLLVTRSTLDAADMRPSASMRGVGRRLRRTALDDSSGGTLAKEDIFRLRAEYAVVAARLADMYDGTALVQIRPLVLQLLETCVGASYLPAPPPPPPTAGTSLVCGPLAVWKYCLPSTCIQDVSTSGKHSLHLEYGKFLYEYRSANASFHIGQRMLRMSHRLDHVTVECHRNELNICESLSSALKEMFKTLSTSTNTCINPLLHGHPDTLMKSWKHHDCFATRHNAFMDGAHIVHWGRIIELKEELVTMESSEIVYEDNVLQKMMITPLDLQIRVGRILRRTREKERRAFLESVEAFMKEMQPPVEEILTEEIVDESTLEGEAAEAAEDTPLDSHTGVTAEDAARESGAPEPGDGAAEAEDSSTPVPVDAEVAEEDPASQAVKDVTTGGMAASTAGEDMAVEPVTRGLEEGGIYGEIATSVQDDTRLEREGVAREATGGGVRQEVTPGVEELVMLERRHAVAMDKIMALPDNTDMTVQEAILLIQTHERARHVRRSFQRKLAKGAIRELVKFRIESPEIFHKSTIAIMAAWRGFSVRRKLGEREKRLGLLVGFYMPHWISEEQQKKVPEVQRHRYEIQEQQQRDYEETQVKVPEVQRHRGRGGVVVRLHASHQGQLCSLSGKEILTRGNRAGRCRWSAGFIGDLPFPRAGHSGAAPFSPRFTPIGSQDLDGVSRPNHLTLSRALTGVVNQKRGASCRRDGLRPETASSRFTSNATELIFKAFVRVETESKKQRNSFIARLTPKQQQISLATHSWKFTSQWRMLTSGNDVYSWRLFSSLSFCPWFTHEPLKMIVLQLTLRHVCNGVPRSLFGSGRNMSTVISHLPHPRGPCGMLVRRLSPPAPLGEPGSIPGGVAPGFSYAGIVPYDAAGRRVFSGPSRFPQPFHSGAAPYSPRLSRPQFSEPSRFLPPPPPICLSPLWLLALDMNCNNGTFLIGRYVLLCTGHTIQATSYATSQIEDPVTERVDDCKPRQTGAS